MVLYRKYRPQKFSDIVGQEHIVQTLASALEKNTFSHGYLFAGPKGSGKTTLARILAKSLNCSANKSEKRTFEPCNKCKSCTEITLGKSMDVIEIDAASNRGIDEIRDLREKIRFAPAGSFYKIYIIDEVHMLTKEAFNALLKTLEEPPKHAIFVMATTEPHKVLPTILSRVQRFDFHRATVEEISRLIKKIAKLEKIEIKNEAIELLARLSGGAYRDALSLLGQVISTNDTGELTLEKVQSVLGLAKDTSVFEFLSALSFKDRKKAFSIISDLYNQGTDLENFTLNLTEILRKMALLKLGQDQTFDLTKEQKEELQKLAKDFSALDLWQMVSKFSEASYKIKSANLPQLPLEMLVFEYTSAQNEDENESFSEPEKNVEKKEKENIKEEIKTEKIEPIKSFKKIDISSEVWAQIVKEAKAHNNSLGALLKDAVISKSDADCITLAFKFKFHAQMMSDPKNTQKIEEIIQKKIGESFKVECITDPELAIKKPSDSEEELFSEAKEIFELEEN